MGQFAKKARGADSQRNACVVGRAFADFDDEDLAEFERLVLLRKWLVINEVFPAGPDALRKHARGICTCADGTPVKGVLRG